MAPHMTGDELDFVHELAAKGTLTVIEMHARLAARRGRKGIAESRENDTRQVAVLRRAVRSRDVTGQRESAYPKGIAAPHLTSFRKVLKGHTFKRGRVEARGRPQKLTAQAVRKLDNARKDLIKKAKGEAEVTRRQDSGTLAYTRWEAQS